MNLRRRLFSQSAIIFAVRIGGAGVTFIVQAMIARFWGATALGEFLILIAAGNLLAIVLPLGFHTTGTYFAAEYAARKDGGSLRRFLLHAYGHIVVPGFLLLLAAGLVMPFMGPTGQMLAALWLPLSIMAAGTAIIYINGAVLVGLEKPIAGFFADTIFRPLLMISTFCLAHFFIGGAELFTMYWMLAIGYLIVALVHFALAVTTARAVPADTSCKPSEQKRWWYFALPWVLISLSSDFFFDIDLLMLTGLMDNHEIAVFGVCTRIFVLASFGVSAVYAVAVPGLLAEEAENNAQGLAGKIADANIVAAGLSALLLVVMMALGPVVLQVFGDGFTEGAVPLSILCAALLVRAVFGPASLILSARNRPYASLPAIGVGLLVLLGANIVLVPTLGLMGAALAAFAAFFTGAFGIWYTARRLTGVDVSIFPALARRVR